MFPTLRFIKPQTYGVIISSSLLSENMGDMNLKPDEDLVKQIRITTRNINNVE